MPDAVTLDDLSAPELPDWFEELHEAMGIPADRPLDADSLLAEAVAREGREDVGDPWFQEPFRVLVRSLEQDGELSPFGRFQVHELLVGLLVTRLRLAALLAAHPEVRDVPIEAPLVILGLPRTGTTHLHEVLAADPGLRWLPYWEGIEPIPAGDQTVPADPDPRIERTDLAMAMLHAAMPHFAAMHAMGTHEPHEEIQLLAASFATMLFEASYEVAEYQDWYRSHDQTPAYLELRTMLQALRFLRPDAGDRWLLKSPQHLEQLGPLLTAFPDARIVMTHRDPVAVTTSMVTLAAYGRRTNYSTVDAVAMGPPWAERIESLLRAGDRDRRLVPDGQLLDVRFADLIADEWAVLADVYRHAGRELTPERRAALQAAIGGAPRDRYGRVAYRSAAVGIDPAERRAALQWYVDRHHLPTEDVR